MNKIISLFMAVLLAMAFSTAAFAGQFANNVPFTKYSTAYVAGFATVYSSAYDVRMFKTKTVTVQGIAISGHTNTSLSGTVLIQCGPTSSGPWNTCVNSSYAQTAISTTSNGTFTWSDAAAYIRASWAKTAGEVSVWLNYLE